MQPLCWFCVLSALNFFDLGRYLFVLLTPLTNECHLLRNSYELIPSLLDIIFIIVMALLLRHEIWMKRQWIVCFIHLTIQLFALLLFPLVSRECLKACLRELNSNLDMKYFIETNYYIPIGIQIYSILVTYGVAFYYANKEGYFVTH